MPSLSRCVAWCVHQIEADVVVGADGVNSKVRNALMLPDTRRDVGIRSLGGAVVDDGQLSGFPTDAATLMVVERGPSMFVGRYTADSRDNIAGEQSGAARRMAG